MKLRNKKTEKRLDFQFWIRIKGVDMSHISAQL